ncbi:MAG: hypothetical protein AB7G54_10875 [Methyloceanibacter sp.]
MLMTMLDLGVSGVASAAPGSFGDPSVSPEGAAAFGPPSWGADGDVRGGVLWPEVAGATLGLVAEVPGLDGETCPLGAAAAGALALGAVVTGGPLGLGSALAGIASISAKNGTARNCGKEREERICSSLVAQNPNARRPHR